MNFLAAHPTESFTLSEISEGLRLSIGSAHRLLTTLTDAGFLTRHPKRKTYALGMALVAIGQAALAQHPGIEVAKRDAAILARDLKVSCRVLAIVDNEQLLLAVAGRVRRGATTDRIGERRAYMPPLGIVRAAWADEAERREYLSRAPAALSENVRDHLAASLDVIRARGFAASASGPAYRALRQFAGAPAAYPREQAYWTGLRQLIADFSAAEMQLFDFKEAGEDGVSAISAPIFAPSGAVSMELTMGDLPAGLTASELGRYTDRLLDASAAVTREIHGRMPQAMPSGLARPRLRSVGNLR